MKKHSEKKSKSYLLSFHAIEECIRQHQGGALIIVRQSGRSRELERLCGEHDIRVKHVKQAPAHIDENAPKYRGYWFEPGGGESRLPEFSRWFKNECSRDDSLVLVLDGVQDTHNLGAIIRSADLFAVSGIIIPKRRSASVNETVERTSAGASRHVPVYTVGNLARTLEDFKNEGFWIYGADMSGVNIRQAKISGKNILVMGSEQKGISSLTKEKCDFFVKIPTKGHIDSLNVSVAAAILCYEIQCRSNNLD